MNKDSGRVSSFDITKVAIELFFNLFVLKFTKKLWALFIIKRKNSSRN